MAEAKILLVFSGTFAGGAEGMMLGLIPLLERAGYLVEVALNGEGEVSSRVEESGKTPHKLSIRGYANKFWPFSYLKKRYSHSDSGTQDEIQTRYCRREGPYSGCSYCWKT